MCLFSQNSTRFLITGQSPCCENRSVCKRRDIYFCDLALLNFREFIVGLYASNFESLANQNACCKYIALQFVFSSHFKKSFDCLELKIDECVAERPAIANALEFIQSTQGNEYCSFNIQTLKCKAEMVDLETLCDLEEAAKCTDNEAGFFDPEDDQCR